MKKPDWEFWRHVPNVRLWQAVLLSLDIDPDQLDPGYRKFDYFWEENPEASKRLRLLNSNLGMGHHCSLSELIEDEAYLLKIRLSEFATWASSVVKWGGLPPELLALASEPRIEQPMSPEQAKSEVTEGNAGTWKEHARQIADECFDRDTANNCRDSLKGYALRVMDEMQNRKIHGPRGRIDNPNTIQKEALQGPLWWANKKK